MTVRDNILQVVLLAPLIQGIIVQFEERAQRAHGPDIFQPYRDLWNESASAPSSDCCRSMSGSRVRMGPAAGRPVHCCPVWSCRLRLLQCGHLNFYLGLISLLLVIILCLTLL
jgi:hypothetical protein